MHGRYGFILYWCVRDIVAIKLIFSIDTEILDLDYESIAVSLPQTELSNLYLDLYVLN